MVVCTVSLRQASMKNHVPPKVQNSPVAKQRRLDKLLDKNSEGTITAKEKGALEQLVAQAEQWMVTNARRVPVTSTGIRSAKSTVPAARYGRRFSGSASSRQRTGGPARPR